MWFKSNFTIPAVAAISFCLIGPTAPAAADILHVPGDFPTIQAAFDAAMDGDEVEVHPGAYFETINFLGKAITVYSTDGPDVTIIDAEQTGTVVTCDSAEGPDTVLDGFTITGGNAYRGGGMRNMDSSPTVTNCTFIGNEAIYGGGMGNSSSSPTVTNCVFTENSAVEDGGGMHNRQDSHPMLIDCTFTNNLANFNGAGVFSVFSCSPTVVNCRFEGNMCGHVGGGFGIRKDCHPVLINCSFINNTAGDFGGAIRSGNTGSSPTVINCLFVGNTSQIGGAYAAGTDIPGQPGLGLIHNCIFWGNVAPLGPQIALNGNHAADVTVTFSDVQGGEAEVYVESGFTLTWGPGNLDADPLFVAPGSGDFRLMPSSPCIDAADNTAVPKGIDTDLDGNPRFVDDPSTKDTGLGDPPIVDMGAYEFQPALCTVDLDNSGDIGVKDLLILLGAWGPCPPKGDCPADFDDSGDVGVKDLLFLLGAWGPCP